MNDSASILLFVLGGLCVGILIVVLVWNRGLRKLMLLRIRELRVSEQRYRTVFDSSPDAMVIHDAGGRILDANSAAVGGYGYAREELLRMTVRDFAAEDMKDATAARLRQMAEGRVRFEWRHRRKDGSEFPVELSSAPIVVGDRHCFLVSARDVTERNLADDALRTERALLQQITASSPVGIVVVHHGGQIALANPAAERIFGLKQDQITRRAYDSPEWKHTDLDGASLSSESLPVARVIAIGKPVFDAEHAIEWPDGRQVLLSVNAAPILDAAGRVERVVAVVSDITERKRGERLLRLEHSISRCLAEADDVPSALKEVMRIICEAKRWGQATFWGVDEAAGVLRFEEFWNVPQSELETYTEGSREAVFAPGVGLVGQVWQSGGPVWVADFGADPRVVQRALARKVGAHGALLFPVVSDGRVMGVFVFLSRKVREPDERLLAVTQVIGSEVGQFLRRKKAEDQVRRLNAALELRVAVRTQALEVANRELEAFSYSVSHDLRAPLRAINGFSHLLEEQYAGSMDEQGRGMFRRVREAAQRMGRLIDDLLELSRISRQAMQVGPVELSAMAREVADELQAGEPERRVEWIIAPRVSAEGDSGLLRVVLQNLLGNAWKYSAKRASARIEFGVTENKGGSGAYFVRDDGAGFDMAYAGKLFGAFQRMHSPVEFSGTGIGLATVARIIRRHGGEVWAEASVGAGATFYFSLGSMQEMQHSGEASHPIPESEPEYAVSAQTPGDKF
jgi:PAS domain S-box-containing protein